MLRQNKDLLPLLFFSCPDLVAKKIVKLYRVQFCIGLPYQLPCPGPPRGLQCQNASSLLNLCVPRLSLCRSPRLLELGHLWRLTLVSYISMLKNYHEDKEPK